MGFDTGGFVMKNLVTKFNISVEVKINVAAVITALAGAIGTLITLLR